jgi:hypothetical protein
MSDDLADQFSQSTPYPRVDKKPCVHELWEKDIACADGMCPLCSAERLRILTEICKPIMELDWCIGYELSKESHVVLDDVKSKLHELFS